MCEPIIYRALLALPAFRVCAFFSFMDQFQVVFTELACVSLILCKFIMGAVKFLVPEGAVHPPALPWLRTDQ